MSETHVSDPADSALSASPGEQLRRQREASGLSIAEVAAALNLRPAVIRGLEEDSYDEVPIATYRRGYLRSYANLLGIDERQVLEAYRTRFGHDELERKVTPVQVTRPPSRLGVWLFRLVTLLVIAGLIGLTLLWWQSRGGSEPPGIGDSGPVAVDGLDGTPSVAEQPAPIDESEALPPLPEQEQELGLLEEPDAPVEPAPEVDAEAARLIAGLPEEAAPVSAPEETETTAEAPVTDPRVLELTFNEQSWTEIFDANNRRIFVGLQEPGTSASVEGEPPFRLTIGNATGVELIWRGEAIDLAARAGANNVARFTLGE